MYNMSSVLLPQNQIQLPQTDANVIHINESATTATSEFKDMRVARCY